MPRTIDSAFEGKEEKYLREVVERKRKEHAKIVGRVSEEEGEEERGEQSSSEEERGEQNSSEEERGEQNSSEEERGEQNSSEEERGEQNSSEEERGEQSSSEEGEKSPEYVSSGITDYLSSPRNSEDEHSPSESSSSDDSPEETVSAETPAPHSIIHERAPLPDVLSDRTDESNKETSPEEEMSPKKKTEFLSKLEKEICEESSTEKYADGRSSDERRAKEYSKEIISETVPSTKDVPTENLPLSEMNQNNGSTSPKEKKRARKKREKRYPSKHYRRRYLPEDRRSSSDEASASVSHKLDACTDPTTQPTESEDKRGLVKSENARNRVRRKRASKVKLNAIKESAAENICALEREGVSCMSLDDTFQVRQNPASNDEVFVQDFIEVEVKSESNKAKFNWRSKEGTTTDFYRGQTVGAQTDGQQKRSKETVESSTDEGSSKFKRTKRDEMDRSEN